MGEETRVNDDIWSRLCDCRDPVVLYGTGNGADKILDELTKRGVSVSGVFASDGFVRERTFRGMKVLSYSECKARFPGMCVLMCFGSSRPEVMENVRRIMGECEFLVPDVPVYGEELFDAAFYAAHEAELQSVRERLADEASVKTFDDVIRFKLTGEPRYLFDCETAEEEVDRLIRLPVGAVIADFGAYNGDTVKKYASLYPSYGEIVAVEPDKRNFRKLCENTAGMRDIVPVNALLSDGVTETHIDGRKGRGTHEAEDGTKISSVSVDSLFAERGVGFMKFDVEGNELAALRGSVRTIKKHRPAMLVSCYHRSGDLFTLPLEILSIRDDYQVYLRKLPGLPAWDCQYYFV